MADHEPAPQALTSSLARGGAEVPGILGHRRTRGHLLNLPFTGPHRMYRECWHGWIWVLTPPSFMATRIDSGAPLQSYGECRCGK